MSEQAAIQGLDNRARELERFADAAERLAAVPEVFLQAICNSSNCSTVPMFGQSNNYQAFKLFSGNSNIRNSITS